MSPTEPAGKRLSLEPMPVQAIMYKFLAPVLSAQFMTEATGSEFVIFSLIPLRPPLAISDKTTKRVRRDVELVARACHSSLFS